MATFHTQYRLKGRIITIRSAEPEDAQQMLSLIQQMAGETPFLARDADEYTMTVEQERAFIQKKKDDPSVRMAVAEVDGEIVAIGEAGYSKLRRYRHTGEVSLSVRKSHWGMGIGRAMLEESLRWLSENGVEKASLNVDATNHRAVALYHRLGFVVEGTFRNVRKMADGSYHDTYRMGLNLSKGAGDDR